MSLAEIYRMERDRIRSANKERQKTNPISYAAGDVAGSIASPINRLLPGANSMRAADMAKAGGTFAAVNAAGRSEAETLPELVGDVVTQGAAGAVLTPVIGKTAEAGLGLAAAGARKLSGVNPAAVDEAANTGIELSVAAASDSRTAKLMDRFLSKFPGSATTMQNAADRTLGQIDDAVNRLGGSRAVTKQEAGAMIQSGAERYVGKFQAVAGKLYDRLDKMIAPGTRVKTKPVNDAIWETTQAASASEGLRKMFDTSEAGRIVKLMQDDIAASAGNRLSYDAVKQYRTLIGRKLQDGHLMRAEDQAVLARLYSGLSDTMKEAAAAKGPEALKAFERANDFYRRGAEQIQKGLEKVTANKYPEQVYEAALSGTKAGGSKISGIMKALNPDEREILRGTVMKQMGAATPGQQNAAGDLFSVNTFLTNWSRMSPEAKNAVFGTGAHRKSVDRLAGVVERIKGVEKFSNASNTGPFITMGGLFMGILGGGLIGGPGLALKIGAAIPGSYGMSKLMTSPKFVSWLADNATKKATPQAVERALKVLPRVAATNPWVQDELKGFISSLKPATTDQPHIQGGTP